MKTKRGKPFLKRKRCAVCGKAIYATRAEALVSVMNLARKKHTERVTIYPCKGGIWHIGNKRGNG